MTFVGYDTRSQEKSSAIGLGLAATVFGAIHRAAWGFSFASGKEQEMWRVCSVIVTVIPACICCFVWICIVLELDSEGVVVGLGVISASFGCLAYVAARAVF